jgi:hypothetical protein
MAALKAYNNNNAGTAKWDTALDMLDGWSPGISLGFQCYGENREVFQLMTDRFRHTYVLGPSGSGKTTHLVWMAMQDIRARTPVTVFASGDVVKRIVQQLDEGMLDNLIAVDFSDQESHVRFNLCDIDIDDKAAVDRAVEEIIYLLKGDVPPGWAGPRFDQKIRMAAYTVFDKDFPYKRSVLCIVKLIVDSQYRGTVLQSIKTPAVLKPWQMDDMAARSNDYGEVQEWVYAKCDIFENNSVLQRVFGAGKTTLDIEEEMAGTKSMLFNIDDSVLSPRVAGIIRRHLTRRTKDGVMRRSLQGEDRLVPRILIYDEFQQWVNDSFAELLSECRKYETGLVLAHQNLRQLVQYSRQTETMSSEVLESILSNVGTLIAFRPSAKDAEVLAPEFELKPEALRRVPRYSATVRLLSDGQPLKPVVVKVPMDKGPFHKDSPGRLRELMIEKGILVANDRDGKDGGHGDEAHGRPCADGRGRDGDPGGDVRAAPAPFPRTGKSSSQGAEASSFLDEWLAKHRTRQRQDGQKTATPAARPADVPSWGSLKDALEKEALGIERRKLLVVLEQAAQRKGAQERAESREGDTND